MELKKIIKFYIPVNVYVFSDESISDGFLDRYKKDYPNGVYNPEMTFENMDRILRQGYKPILRKLHSMTEEEAQEIWKLLDWNKNFPKEHMAEEICLEFDTIEDDDGREINSSWKYFIQIMPYLLSKGFDLWNLIDSNQAIDADILKQKT